MDILLPSKFWTGKMTRALIIPFGLLFIPLSLPAKDIYLAQEAMGKGTGADCANALARTYFDSRWNWGNGASDIGPGTTVHLCGTITAPAGATYFLQFRDGGTSGNPITLLFEPGAVLQAPWWGKGGAINSHHRDYVIVDLGKDGVIKATDNGTKLTYHNDGAAIVMDGSSNSEVRNGGMIGPIYEHAYDLSDENAQDTFGVQWKGGNDNSIHNTNATGAHWCLYYSYPGGTTTSNVRIYGNTGVECDHTLALGDGNEEAILTGTNQIFGNTFHDAVNWDDAADYNHHDGIHVWAVHNASRISGLQIYNNYIYGDWGIRTSGFIYVENRAGGVISNVLIANNLMVNTAKDDKHRPAEGCVFNYATDSMLYNNTCVQNSYDGDGSCFVVYGTGSTIKNNICSTARTGIYVEPGQGSVTASDHNVYHNMSMRNAFYTGKVWCQDLSEWQSQTGFDAHSSTGNVKWNASFRIQAGSAAIGRGENLTSFGFAVLNVDLAGVARPATGAWDSGAFQAPERPARPGRASH